MPLKKHFQSRGAAAEDGYIKLQCVPDERVGQLLIELRLICQLSHIVEPNASRWEIMVSGRKSVRSYSTLTNN